MTNVVKKAKDRNLAEQAVISQKFTIQKLILCCLFVYVCKILLTHRKAIYPMLACINAFKSKKVNF